jgi:hypothetical protein
MFDVADDENWLTRCAAQGDQLVGCVGQPGLLRAGESLTLLAVRAKKDERDMSKEQWRA